MQRGSRQFSIHLFRDLKDLNLTFKQSLYGILSFSINITKEALGHKIVAVAVHCSWHLCDINLNRISLDCFMLFVNASF